MTFKLFAVFLKVSLTFFSSFHLPSTERALVQSQKQNKFTLRG